MSPDLEARLHLLRSNRAALMVMLRRSLDSTLAVEDVVAIVADTGDSVGGCLARALVERVPGLDVEAEAGRAHARGEIPTLVAVVPAAAAVDIFRMSNPSVSAGIGQPLVPGRVRIVVVGGGGSTLLQVPTFSLKPAATA